MESTRIINTNTTYFNTIDFTNHINNSHAEQSTTLISYTHSFNQQKNHINSQNINCTLVHNTNTIDNNNHHYQHTEDNQIPYSMQSTNLVKSNDHMHNNSSVNVNTNTNEANSVAWKFEFQTISDKLNLKETPLEFIDSSLDSSLETDNSRITDDPIESQLTTQANNSLIKEDKNKDDMGKASKHHSNNLHEFKDYSFSTDFFLKNKNGKNPSISLITHSNDNNNNTNKLKFNNNYNILDQSIIESLLLSQPNNKNPYTKDSTAISEHNIPYLLSSSSTESKTKDIKTPIKEGEEDLQKIIDDIKSKPWNQHCDQQAPSVRSTATTNYTTGTNNNELSGSNSFVDMSLHNKEISLNETKNGISYIMPFTRKLSKTCHNLQSLSEANNNPNSLKQNLEIIIDPLNTNVSRKTSYNATSLDISPTLPRNEYHPFETKTNQNLPNSLLGHSYTLSLNLNSQDKNDIESPLLSIKQQHQHIFENVLPLDNHLDNPYQHSQQLQSESYVPDPSTQLGIDPQTPKKNLQHLLTPIKHSPNQIPRSKSSLRIMPSPVLNSSQSIKNIKAIKQRPRHPTTAWFNTSSKINTNFLEGLENIETLGDDPKAKPTHKMTPRLNLKDKSRYIGYDEFTPTKKMLDYPKNYEVYWVDSDPRYEIEIPISTEIRLRTEGHLEASPDHTHAIHTSAYTHNSNVTENKKNFMTTNTHYTRHTNDNHSLTNPNKRVESIPLMTFCLSCEKIISTKEINSHLENCICMNQAFIQRTLENVFHVQEKSTIDNRIQDLNKRHDALINLLYLKRQVLINNKNKIKNLELEKLIELTFSMIELAHQIKDNNESFDKLKSNLQILEDKIDLLKSFNEPALSEILLTYFKKLATYAKQKLLLVDQIRLSNARLSYRARIDHSSHRKNITTNIGYEAISTSPQPQSSSRATISTLKLNRTQISYTVFESNKIESNNMRSQPKNNTINVFSQSNTYDGRIDDNKRVITSWIAEAARYDNPLTTPEKPNRAYNNNSYADNSSTKSNTDRNISYGYPHLMRSQRFSQREALAFVLKQNENNLSIKNEIILKSSKDQNISIQDLYEGAIRFRNSNIENQF